MTDVNWAKEYDWLRIANAAALFAALVAGEDDRCWRQQDLAKAAGLNRSILSSSLRILAQKGLVVREPGAGSSVVPLPESTLRVVLRDKPEYRLVQLLTRLVCRRGEPSLAILINVLSEAHGHFPEGEITSHPDSSPWLVDNAALPISVVLRAGRTGLTAIEVTRLLGGSVEVVRTALSAAARHSGLIRIQGKENQPSLYFPAEGWQGALGQIPGRYLALLALAASQARGLPPLEATVAALAEA